MATFKKIDYGRSLYDGLRAYFSVNSSGQLSILYKLLFCIVQPMQVPFDLLNAQRQVNKIVANCKWQIGQLTNVLNYLFDPDLSRIYITQSIANIVSATTFEYPAIQNITEFGGGNPVFVRGFFDRSAQTLVTINVPEGSDIGAITAIVEQIRIQGIAYQIVYI